MIYLKIRPNHVLCCPFFCLQFQDSGKFLHLSGEVWPAQYESLNRCEKLTDQKLGKADIAIFFGHDDSLHGKFGGLAHLGVACKNGPKMYRCQLMMWQFNPSSTATVLSHEIGHNIGMEHDHYAPHKASGCDKTGIMSYGNHPMQWSACSKADFEAHYLKYKEHWCMEEDEDACKTV